MDYLVAREQRLAAEEPDVCIRSWWRLNPELTGERKLGPAWINWTQNQWVIVCLLVTHTEKPQV